MTVGCWILIESRHNRMFRWYSILPVFLILLLIGCRPEAPPLVVPHTSAGTLPAPALEGEPGSTPTLEEPSVTPATPVGSNLTPTPNLPTASFPLAALPREPRWEIQATEPISQLLDLRGALDASFSINTGAPADASLGLNSGQTLATHVYAAVGAFPTVRDEITLEELRTIDLIADPTTAALWQLEFPNLKSLPAGEIENYVWNNRSAVALVPFDNLKPAFKVFILDGHSVLKRGLDVEAYPLVRRIGLGGDAEAIAALQQQITPTTNRREERLTRLAMTGVTALVRATAAQMESAGVLFPGEEVAPVLQEADVAHISNEVAFAEDCPYPDPVSQSLIFCSRDHYFELLTHLGTDVIEVTGNHANDYGPGSMARSLDFYEEAGMVYYGGGRDLVDAQKAAIISDHGNSLAFVGCNPVGPGFAWATESRAGAAPCNDYAQIEGRIAALKKEGHVIIATMQYQEIYAYLPTAAQVRDFGRLATAGADIVSGSQSHHPQAFAIQDGSFIHYGLGNLFFDQMDRLATRQTMVDIYTIYDGRVVSVELWTGLIEFYARPRVMTPTERADLLNAVFVASGW